MAILPEFFLFMISLFIGLHLQWVFKTDTTAWTFLRDKLRCVLAK